jgi:hypothetical protein
LRCGVFQNLGGLDGVRITTLPSNAAPEVSQMVVRSAPGRRAAPVFEEVARRLRLVSIWRAVDRLIAFS